MKQSRTGLGLRMGALLALVLLVQGCSAIGAYNVIAGRDDVADPVSTSIAYGAHGRQQLDVYAPISNGKAAPVIVFFYGGSWNSGNRQDYAFVGSALASRGFLTIIADYRLVPEVHFPGFLQDGAIAVRWAQDNAASYGGDPRRIALAGHSAGAYNAMMLALDPTYLRAASVDRSSIKAVVGLSGPYDFYPFDVPESRAAFGQVIRPERTQPINLVNGKPPAAFLATGSDDTTVLPRNAYALATKLRANGADVVVKTYKGLDHAGTLLSLSKLRRDKAPVLEDMMVFLEQRLGLKSGNQMANR